MGPSASHQPNAFQLKVASSPRPSSVRERAGHSQSRLKDKYRCFLYLFNIPVTRIPDTSSNIIIIMSSLNPVTEAGQGYSFFLGSAMPSVLTGTAKDTHTGGEIRPSISVCTSSEDILNSLSIDASAEVSCAWGSFKDRLEYSKSLTRNSNSVTILVVVKKITGVFEFVDPQFRTGHSFKSAAALYRQGGDCYVSSISTGGQYLASYQFHASSEEEKESIKNDAEAEVKGFGADAKFSLSTAVSNVSSKHNMSFQFNQVAIGFSQHDLPDPSNVVDFALSFGTKDLDHAEVLNFSVQPYSTLDDCPDDIGQLDAYRDSYLGFPGHAGLAAAEDRAQQAIAAIQQTRRLYEHYRCLPAEPTFGEKIKKCQDILDAIADWRHHVHLNPSATGIPTPSIDSSALIYPVAQYNIFDGPKTPGFVDRSTQPSGPIPFRIEHFDSAIPIQAVPNLVSVSYIDTSDRAGLKVGYRQAEPETREWEASYGPFGNAFPRLFLGPDENIMSVQVTRSTDDWIIKRIKWVTDHQEVTRPDINEGDTDTLWKPELGTDSFLGFTGCARVLGNQGTLIGLAVSFVRFFPPIWKPVPGLDFS